MAKAEVFKEYKLTIAGKLFIWPVIKKQDWTICVQTELGKLWLEKCHFTFSKEHVSVAEDQVDQYINWLEFNLNNDSNFYVHVEQVDDEALSNTRRGKFKFDYMPHKWCEESNKWVELGLTAKTVEMPRSEIDFIDGKTLAPFWLVRSKTSGGGRDSLFPIRLVKIEALKTMIKSY